MAKPNYGIDAPTVLRNLSIGAGTGIIGGLVLIHYAGEIGRPFVSTGLAAALGACCCCGAACSGSSGRATRS